MKRTCASIVETQRHAEARPSVAGKNNFPRTACCNLGPQGAPRRPPPVNVGQCRVDDPYALHWIHARIFRPALGGVFQARYQISRYVIRLFWSLLCASLHLFGPPQNMSEYQVRDPSHSVQGGMSRHLCCLSAHGRTHLPWHWHECSASQDVIAAVLRCRFAPLPSWRPQVRRLSMSVIPEMQGFSLQKGPTR